MTGGSSAAGGASGRVAWDRFTRALRIIFFLYAAALATATHWPSLTAGPAPFNYFDKLVHIGAFGLWTLLLIGASLRRPTLGRANILQSAVLGVLYSGLDEATQSLPGLNRHSSWSDYFANCVGVVLAAGGAAVLARAYKSL